MTRVARLVLLATIPAFAQAPPKYVIGVDLFGSQSCPVFIGSVHQGSAAVAAGIKPGDRLVAIDNQAISDMRDAAKKLRPQMPGTVTLQLIRKEPYTVTVQKEPWNIELKARGMKALKDGSLVPADATEAEIKHFSAVRQSLDSSSGVTRVFPTHYPERETLYYSGFEIFEWDNRIGVGGIEDGPASRAGVRWGDLISSVNGVDPRGKSVAELQHLFTSDAPQTMTLVVERAGVRKFTFQLEDASAVLRDNDKQIVQGEIIPRWVSPEYLHCFRVRRTNFYSGLFLNALSPARWLARNPHCAQNARERRTKGACLCKRLIAAVCDSIQKFE